MKRNNYQMPCIKTHQVTLVKMLCTSGSGNMITEGKSNVGISYGGEGSGVARSRNMDDWDEE